MKKKRDYPQAGLATVACVDSLWSVDVRRSKSVSALEIKMPLDLGETIR